MVTVTTSPFDGPLSELRDHIEDVAIWEARNEPDAHTRRCASDAVDAIDAMLRGLHSVRQELISQIRAADNATTQRADELLRHRPSHDLR